MKYSHIYFDINPTLAIQKLEELQTIAPNSAIAQREMAEAYYKNSQYTKAAEAYEKYMQNPNHFQTDRPRLATLLFYGKRFDESLELAKDILSRFPYTVYQIKHIQECIRTHRFRGENYPKSIEAKILFDVDKLDSPGCIRIARTFLFKGAIGEPIYSFKKDTFEIDYDAPSFIREYNFKLSKIGQ